MWMQFSFYPFNVSIHNKTPTRRHTLHVLETYLFQTQICWWQIFSGQDTTLCKLWIIFPSIASYIMSTDVLQTSLSLCFCTSSNTLCTWHFSRKPEGKRPHERYGQRWEDNINMDLVLRCGLHWPGSGQRPVVGSFEHGNKIFEFRKRRGISWLAQWLSAS